MSANRLTLVLALVISLCGCWKRNAADKLDKKDGRPLVKDTDLSQGDSSNEPGKNKQADKNNSLDGQNNKSSGGGNSDRAGTGTYEKALALAVEQLGDIPPAPEGFTGESLPADTEIPADIQARVTTYDDGYIDDAIAFTKHAHPTVRYKAIERLRFIDNDDYDLDKIVEALRAAMQDPVVKNQLIAIDTLDHYKQNARNALLQLFQLALDPQEDIRKAALDCLRILGPASEPLTPALIQLLKKPDYPDHFKVINVLGEVGPSAVAAADPMMPFIEKHYYSDLSAALGKINATGHVLNLLQSSDEDMQSKGAVAVQHLQTFDSAMTPILIAMSTKDDFSAKIESVDALAAIRPTTKKIVAALGKATTDKENLVRSSAIQALGKIDPKMEEAIPFLVAATKDSYEFAADQATEALGKFQSSPEMRLNLILDQMMGTTEETYSQNDAIKNGAADFYPILMKMVQDKSIDEAKRAVALFATQQVFFTDEFRSNNKQNEFNNLLKTLFQNDNSVQVKSACAILVNRFSDHDISRDAYLPVLIESLHESNIGFVRNNTVEYLADVAWRMEPAEQQKVAKAFNELLLDDDKNIRSSAAYKLHDCEEAASLAIPNLLTVAKRPAQDGDYSRSWAVISIGKIGTQPDKSIPVLMQILKDDQSDLRGDAIVSAAKVIAKNNLPADDLIPLIKNCLEQKKGYLPPWIRAAGELGEKGAPLTSLLAKQLDDKSTFDDAANALGKIGPHATDAVPKLIERAKALSGYDRNHMLEAIAEIGTHADEFVAAYPELAKDIENIGDVVEVLTVYGEKAKPLAPEVAKLLELKGLSSKRRVIEFLVSCKANDPVIIENIKRIATSENEDNYVREYADEALETLAPTDSYVIAKKMQSVARMGPAESKKYFEPLGERASTILDAGIKSPESQMRIAIAKILPNVLPPEQAIEKLQTLLGDPDANVQQNAAVQLDQLGVCTPKVLGPLTKSLANEEFWNTRWQLAALGAGVIDPMLTLMLDPQQDIQLRIKIAETFNSYSSSYRPGQLPSVLVDALAADDALNQRLATIAAVNLGFSNDAHAPVLIGAVNDKDSEIQLRTNALQTLGKIRFTDGYPTKEVLQHVIEIAKGETPELVDIAFEILQSIKLDENQIDSLLSLYNDEKTSERAFKTICYRNTSSDKFLPFLIDALKSDDSDNRSEIRYAINKYLPAATDQIISIFVDTNASESVRLNAGILLLNSNIKLNDSQQPIVKNLLADKSPQLKLTAANLLAKSGLQTDNLSQQLFDSLKSDNYQLRNSAIQSLINSPDLLNPIRDKLFDALVNSGNEQFRDAALRLLTVQKDLTDQQANQVIDAYFATKENSRYPFNRAIVQSEKLRQSLVSRFEKSDNRKQKATLKLFAGVQQNDDFDRKPLIDLARSVFESDAGDLQLDAAIALASLHRESSDVAEVLIQHLYDSESESVNYDVKRAINQMKDLKPVLPYAIRLLDKRSRRIRSITAIPESWSGCG